MNRIFKFRVWDKHANKWFRACYMTEFNLPKLTLNFGKQYVIQQFTALKDKNNKEIYEGDIVEYSGPDGDSENKPLKVYYDMEWAHFLAGDFCFGPHITKHLEIKGNIFENPELLK